MIACPTHRRLRGSWPRRSARVGRPDWKFRTPTVDNRGMERILGIVGGTGPESTADYYRTLIDTWRARGPANTYPRAIINSVEGGEIISLLGSGDHEAVGRLLSTAVLQLAAAGVGTIILASNASHLAFDQVAASSPVPLIHIVDAASAAARQRGHRTLGIFGTRFIMSSGLYPDRFAAAGMRVVAPTAGEQAFIHDAYLGELVRGVFRDDTRDRLVDILAAMRDRDGIDGLILGGTELALILTAATYADVPILNTARIHVEAAVDWLLEGDATGPNS
jgi:aspartate racemase